MSSSQAQQLRCLLKRSAYGQEPGIKPLLQRIRSDLAVHERLGSGHSAEAVESATAALSHFRGPAYGELRAGCLASAFNLFFWEGRADRALHAAQLIEHIGLASGNVDLRGKARNLMGLAAADMGNIGESLSYYAEALADSRKTQNCIRQAAVLLNTGVALNYAGLCEEAVPCFLE